MRMPGWLFIFVMALSFGVVLYGIQLPAGAGHTCGEFSCDEPAIQRIRPASSPCNLPGASNTDCVTGPEIYWTCADISRVLLMSEDGKRWCYKPHVNEKETP